MWELYLARLLRFTFPKRGHLCRGSMRPPPLWGTVLVICDSDKCHLIDGPAHPILGRDVLKTELPQSKYTYKIPKGTELLLPSTPLSPYHKRHRGEVSTHWDWPGGRQWGGLVRAPVLPRQTDGIFISLDERCWCLLFPPYPLLNQPLLHFLLFSIYHHLCTKLLEVLVSQSIALRNSSCLSTILCSQPHLLLESEPLISCFSVS